ncbi:hypothetical protein [Deinococcus alpinitundrae]|uniref:hypothetical protein n=1 Tax=Deinococcus alpinitundrae TaxID=468913 RepID=UPI00137B3490|nr:hypothetical protein [Deinococcus alpinitundrae]
MTRPLPRFADLYLGFPEVNFGPLAFECLPEAESLLRVRAFLDELRRRTTRQFSPRACREGNH